jgi:NTP pyrophosphatase (non-canonical NTP hydrolase)
MRDTTLATIKDLSLADKKTLSQKALKAAEEVGELAKVILPYDNAPATTHRFVETDKILEEVSDVMLTVLSIAYELGYTNTDIDQMMLEKSKKWLDLQTRDGLVPGQIPYEIHVTVREPDDIEHFRKVCHTIGVKPIILDLQNSTGTSVIKDVMTSSTFFGNNRLAYRECTRIALLLKENGFNVVREKIETVPWHPAAPSRTHMNPMMPPNCYFECHIPVVIEDNSADQLWLRNFAGQHGCHLSRNVFKRNNDGTVTQMMTYRDFNGTREGVAAYVDAILINLGHRRPEKTITEFAIYDTKVSHDAAWLTNPA